MRIHVPRPNLTLIFVLSLIILLNACGHAKISSANAPGSSTDQTDKSPFPLLWESSQKDGMQWSAFTYQFINGNAANTLLPGTADIENFCPNYARLSDPQRVNFWAFLVSAVAKYESSFNPAGRYKETTMGIDPVTNLPVY